MKKTFLICLILLFLIQFSFLSFLDWDTNVPNLILILAISFGFNQSFEKNFWWLFIAGFLFEMFSVEFFGFNLALFILVGSLAWFLKNVVINRERGFFLEIIFWLIIKLCWDLFNKLGLSILNFFQKTDGLVWEKINFTNYLFEILVFILIGILIRKIWEIVENILIKNNEEKNKIRN
jgi:hypothetical protein